MIFKYIEYKNQVIKQEQTVFNKGERVRIYKDLLVINL